MTINIFHILRKGEYMAILRTINTISFCVYVLMYHLDCALFII